MISISVWYKLPLLFLFCRRLNSSYWSLDSSLDSIEACSAIILLSKTLHSEKKRRTNTKKTFVKSKYTLNLFWITHPTRLLGALSKRDTFMHLHVVFYIV